jgi:hypothetical protein
VKIGQNRRKPKISLSVQLFIWSSRKFLVSLYRVINYNDMIKKTAKTEQIIISYTLQVIFLWKENVLNLMKSWQHRDKLTYNSVNHCNA